LLVHAGSGGVGSSAIQVAKHLGARVVATASSEEKQSVAREQGADEVFGYDEFAEKVRADVVLDPVGGEVFAQSFGVLKPLGTVVAIGFAGGWWEPLDPAPLVGRNLGLQGFYLGRLMRHNRDRPRGDRRAAPAVVVWRGEAAGRRDVPLERAGDAHELIESRKHGEGRPCSQDGSCHGASGGIGQAIVERLEREGTEVQELDLVTGFDVSDPTAWQSVDRVELACLNAGVATSTPSITELTGDEYRRVIAVNVHGVVYGVRRLAREMERRRDRRHASLAGLTGVESDPIYALTKHAVVGFVRLSRPSWPSARSDQRGLPRVRRHADGRRRASRSAGGRRVSAVAAGGRRRGRCWRREATEPERRGSCSRAETPSPTASGASRARASAARKASRLRSEALTPSNSGGRRP
jgi:NAD(P)-dependent dehydrogenase (short-subunit alcohol dehydrogenase family)